MTATTPPYQSAVEIVTAYVDGLIRSDLADRVENDELTFEFLRDVSRARLVEPLRSALKDDPSFVTAVADQLQRLLPLASSSREAAAAATLLVRIAKPIISFPEGASIHSLALELQAIIQERDEKQLQIELALQLVCNRDSREQAVELLLKEPGVVESVREHYLEASSPSELLEKIRERWRSQGVDDVGASERIFEGLSPFFHSCPAPGGSSEAVVLTGLFAKALASPASDRVAGVVSWLKQAALSQRVVQWEFFERQERGVYSSKAGDLPTLADPNFLAKLTVAWWDYVAHFEPIPIGAPVRRLEPRTISPHLPYSAEIALAGFKAILANLSTMAPVDAHQKVTAQMAREWRLSGRAGTLLIHDGEITYWALRWLIMNQCEGGQWRLPFPIGSTFEWRDSDFARLLEFLGLGLTGDGDVVLTPRWRSFIRWGALVPALNLEGAPLNTSTLLSMEDWLARVAAHFGDHDDPIEKSRAPFLPLEVFLRAYRPWPSQLVVTTGHAQRREGEIVPLSFSFGTVIGDLPFATHGEWFRREDGVGEEESGRKLFLSWLNNHCTLLSGVGMSLGVSSEMARAALLGGSEDFFDLIWGKTADWFTNDGPRPSHTWLEASQEEDGVRSLTLVLDHLETITGKGAEFWGAGSYDLWEELKRFFGPKALCQGGATGSYALTLGGVWIIALSFARKTFGTDVPSDLFLTNGDLRKETVLLPQDDFEVHRDIAVKLVGVFRKLFVRNQGGDCTILGIHRVEGELKFDLDIPFYQRSDTGERSFWSALLGREGGAREAIADLHGALQTRRPGWVPADVLVRPIGAAFGEKMQLVIRRGR